MKWKVNYFLECAIERANKANSESQRAYCDLIDALHELKRQHELGPNLQSLDKINKAWTKIKRSYRHVDPDLFEKFRHDSQLQYMFKEFVTEGKVTYR